MSGKPNSSFLSKLLSSKEVSKPSSSDVVERIGRPPHPHEAGTVSQGNVCPVCEKYTVSEFDMELVGTRSDLDADDVELRARFTCGLCMQSFDLGLTMFDPRGTPGLTLFQGEDRLQPPVPPRGQYPCPRCLKTTQTSFLGMTLYLRELAKRQCQSACPAERIELPDVHEKEIRTGCNSSCNSGLLENKSLARRIIRTVLGLGFE